MKLRDYQQDLAARVEAEWAVGHRVVLMRLETGGGKTPILAQIVDDHAGFIAAIAHRDKLVEQVSLMLARAGIRHDLICSEKTKRIIMRKHIRKFGQSFYVPGARCRVASIKTLVNSKDIDDWLKQVTLWIVDEGHHVLRDNVWGKGVAKFTHPQCHGLLLTATAGRPDKQGLGRKADGFADVMVEGPPMRWLIDQGYLCDYKVISPPTDLVSTEAPRGKDGEYTHTQIKDSERASHIVGDIPRHYLKFAKGLKGITFCGTVETAIKTVDAYRAVGISAELITGNTDPTVRDAIFDRLENGELLQIIAVDVISEGVDLPIVQVGSFARLTGSFVTWLQQLGRLLRPNYAPGYDLTTREGRLAAIAASDKPYAILIDHIDGIRNPGLGPPDRPRIYSLERGEKRAVNDNDDYVPQTVCTNPDPEIACYRSYPRTKRNCPFCGYGPEPAERSQPEHVDGDLGLMDPMALLILQGRVLDIHISRGWHDADQLARRIPSIALNRNWEAYLRKRDAQVALRSSMDRLAGYWHAEGQQDYEIQRQFYLRFGYDVITAQGLDVNDANALRERIDAIVNRL